MHVSHAASPVELEADFVVVGSGAGGATAATTLAASGASVAVVEAGPWRRPEEYPSSAYGAMRDLFDDWGSNIARGRAMWPVLQGRVVGGTTVINSAICVRTPGDIFEQWRREHGLDGLEEDVGRAQDGLEQQLTVEQTAHGAMRQNNLLPFTGAAALGFESHTMRRYARGCVGSGRCMSGCRDLRKQSLDVAFVTGFEASGGIVLSNAPVRRVRIERGVAVGVTGRFRDPRSGRSGAAFTVRARRAVIVAASATHSPALLQRSGVRSPALGRYFRAHPGTGVFATYDEPVDLSLGATQGWASTAFRTDPGFKLESLSLPLDLVASRLPGAGTALMERLVGARHLAMWVHAVRAETTGTVRDSWFGSPIVKYSLNRPDMERFRKGTAMVARVHFASGATTVLPGVFGLPPEIGPDQVHLIEEGPLDPRAYFAVLTHLFGGCVMGSDPERSVVDDRGRVRGVKGLLVADASVIPTNLGVNPQHTIMALARVFSERLLA